MPISIGEGVQGGRAGPLDASEAIPDPMAFIFVALWSLQLLLITT